VRGFWCCSWYGDGEGEGEGDGVLDAKAEEEGGGDGEVMGSEVLSRVSGVAGGWGDERGVAGVDVVDVVGDVGGRDVARNAGAGEGEEVKEMAVLLRRAGGIHAAGAGALETKGGVAGATSSGAATLQFALLDVPVTLDMCPVTLDTCPAVDTCPAAPEATPTAAAVAFVWGVLEAQRGREAIAPVPLPAAAPSGASRETRVRVTTVTQPLEGSVSSTVMKPKGGTWS